MYSITKTTTFDSIDTSYYTTNKSIGRAREEQINFSHNCDTTSLQNGQRVHSLKFLYDRSGIVGLEVELTRPQKPNEVILVGEQSRFCFDKSFRFKNDEWLTTLYIRERRDEFQGLLLKTSAGRKFEFGDVDGYSPRCNGDQEVGSGILVGVFGSKGIGSLPIITSLGFAMLRKIEDAEIVRNLYKGTKVHLYLDSGRQITTKFNLSKEWICTGVLMATSGTDDQQDKEDCGTDDQQDKEDCGTDDQQDKEDCGTDDQQDKEDFDSDD